MGGRTSAANLRRRSKRAGHLPWHKKPKLVTVQVLDSQTQLWTFRPRVLGLNELSRRWKFHKEKSEWKAAVARLLQFHRDPDSLRHAKPVTLSSLYFEPSVSRDPHNIDGGAMKALLDALVECGILPDDNQAWIKGSYTFDWRLDKADPRVELTIREA